MSLEIEQAVDTFKLECDELLQEMVDGLLRLENTPDDVDTINNIFRAAHTIKGTGGVFGFDEVVAFTHDVESLLGKVRDGEIEIDSDLIALLLNSGDHMRALVQHATEGEDVGVQDQAVIKQGQSLTQQLHAFIDEPPPPVSVDKELADGENAVRAVTDNWHLSLRFGHDVFRNGMDPLSFIRYLGKLGKIVELTTLLDQLPKPDKMDPESCYLGFEIDLQSDADKTTIEQVFEFVRDDCQICILPPHSHIDQYIQLIKELPEDDSALGEMLVKGGALTEPEMYQALLDQSTEIERSKNKVHSKLGEILVEQDVIDQQVVNAALNKQQKIRTTKEHSVTRTLRVDAVKLDQLINLIGELVIASASCYLQAQRSGDDLLLEAHSTTARLVDEIRDSTLQLRMVQIGETFNRFQRVVRDVSKGMGKNIQLKIYGGDTELDKTVVEKIADPLMHLVRNAIDHGIESAEQRHAQGKPNQGTVSLNAYHDSGSIVIEVSDDGAGLKRDKILAKAIQKGLVESNQKLSDQEIYRLIFEAGFSTADKVTDLSGRGVGMDVVRRNIEALRGSADVDSESGVGSTVSIRLPLTLAIIDGFMVSVSGVSYILPLDMVVECVELNEHDREATLEHHYINLRGELLPFVRLRDLFYEKQDKEAELRENIVVVEYAGHRAGLVVDQLLGEFQTVIKPLGKVFQSLRGLSGATILGSGKVAMIIDVPALVSKAMKLEAQKVSMAT